MRKRKIRIVGEGQCSGGNVDKATIIGSGVITDHIKCRVLKIMGEGQIRGDVESEYLKIMGEGEILGEVQTQKLKITGSGKIKKNVVATQVSFSGAAEINGNLKGDYISIRGESRIDGDITGNQIKIIGSVKHDHMISGEIVKISSYKGTNINEIGGTRVIIKENLGWLREKIGQRCYPVEIGTIEADDIEIRNTNVREIYGENIIIGSGCTIEKVEYSGTLKIDESSQVREKIKV